MGKVRGVRMEYMGRTRQSPGMMDKLNVVRWSQNISATIRGVMVVGQTKKGILL